MRRHLSQRSLKRAEWFADLANALREAERLLALLDADGGYPGERARLRLRIQELRSEVERLNRVWQTQGRVVGGAWPEDPPARCGKG